MDLVERHERLKQLRLVVMKMRDDLGSAEMLRTVLMWAAEIGDRMLYAEYVAIVREMWDGWKQLKPSDYHRRNQR